MKIMKQKEKIRWQFAGVLALALVSGVIAYPSVFSYFPFPNAASVENSLKVNLGLDLQGGIHLEYAADTSQVPVGGNRSNAWSGSVEAPCCTAPPSP